MNRNILVPDRRLFLGSALSLAAFYEVRGAFAEELMRTPAQMEGPFYPDKLPLDTDNDLLVINDKITPAVGTITHLSGRVLDLKGAPVRNAVVEIWQCDANGAYLHTDGAETVKRDKNFQGFGRFTTNAKGEYYFRTIKPVPYPGRPAPHIHYKVLKGGKSLLTTQLYIAGEARNAKDGVFNSTRDPKGRAALCAKFEPMAGSKIGELTATFDIVLGATPAG